MNIVEGKFKFKSMPNCRTETLYCFLHHAKKKFCTPQEVHKWHVSPPRNWLGIGYAFFVAKDGLITTCRPIHVSGAQAKGYNNVSIGICFEGNYEEEENMPPEQFKAGQELLEMINFIYPSIEFLKHSDKVDTLCPGKNFPFDEIIDLTNLHKKDLYCEQILTQYKSENEKLKAEVEYLSTELEKVEDIIKKNREYTQKLRSDYQAIVSRLQKEKSDLEKLIK